MNYINLSVVGTDLSSPQLFITWWHALCNIETAQWLSCKGKQELILFFCALVIKDVRANVAIFEYYVFVMCSNHSTQSFRTLV